MKGLSSSLSRRSLLKALGTGAAAYPFYRLLENSAVEAQAEAPPLRFLAVYIPNGTSYEYFRPRATGSDMPGSATETDFNLTYDLSVLAPLEPFRQKVLILDALDFDCHVIDRGWGHNAMGTILTGTPNKPMAFDHDGPSLDHYLASKIGQTTAVPQLNICVGENYNWTIMDQYVFASSGTWVSEVLDPKVIYNQAFGSFQAANEADPAVAIMNARQKSKLDFVAGDIQRLRSRVGAAEGAKLDVHLESIRSIERRLDASNSTVAGCVKPAAPAISREYLMRTDGAGPDPADMETLWNLHADLVAQAFACDRTRIATMRLGQSPGMAMPSLGAEFAGDNHNNFQHKQSSYRNDFKYDAVAQGLAKMQRSHYEQVAYLLKALDRIQEGDGTVLDHTIVMVSSEMGNTARHDSSDISFVLAGGGGKFKMGRYLNLKPAADASPIAHNKLLVSILHAFGVDQDTYGWVDSKGPLPGLV